MTGLKTLFAVCLFAAASTTMADSFYPSPTGWRGPIRDAGRPWLKTPSSQASPKVNQQGEFAVNQWHWDSANRYYWTFETNGRRYWYYYPTTGTYLAR